jgi:hypothetical protein
MISPAFSSRRSGFVLITLGFVGCTTLTKVDWSLIPAELPAAGSAGTSSTAGSSQGGQSDAEGGVAGQTNAGQSGQGEGGDAGEAGAAGMPGGGSDTSGAGGGGTGGGGVGGMGGSAGSAGGGNGGTAGGDTGAPKCSTYPATPASIDLTNKIVLFDGGAQAAGAAWGGRVGLDAKCVAAAGPLGITKTTIHAFISADADEPLTPGADSNFVSKYAMPTAPAVVSKLGIKVADSAGTITGFTTSLICAGVFTADVTAWLSGVGDGGGSDPTLSCSGWTLRTESLTVHGNVGLTDTVNRLFHDNLLSDHWVSCDNSSAHLMCVGWGD